MPVIVDCEWLLLLVRIDELKENSRVTLILLDLIELYNRIKCLTNASEVLHSLCATTTLEEEFLVYNA